MKLLLTLFLATAALANAQCTPSVTDVVWIAADTDTIGASFPANGDAGLWCDNTGEELAWWFIVDDCGKTIKTVTITTKQNGKLIRDEKEAFYPYMSFGDYSSYVRGGAFPGRNVRGIDLTRGSSTSYEVSAVIKTGDDKTYKSTFTLQLLESCYRRRLQGGAEDATPIMPED